MSLFVIHVIISDPPTVREVTVERPGGETLAQLFEYLQEVHNVGGDLSRWIIEVANRQAIWTLRLEELPHDVSGRLSIRLIAVNKDSGVLINELREVMTGADATTSDEFGPPSPMPGTVQRPSLPKPAPSAPASAAPAPKFTKERRSQVEVTLPKVPPEATAVEESVPIAESDDSLRMATVRYYYRMNPMRSYPLLVVLSRREIEEIVRKHVTQSRSESFSVDATELVEIEPILPGCSCWPAKEQVSVEGDQPAAANFWVVPQLLGKVRGAKVLVRQRGRLLCEIPLEIVVCRQLLTLVFGALSLISPYIGMATKDFARVMKKVGVEPSIHSEMDSFAIWAKCGRWAFDIFEPETLGILLMTIAAICYLLFRPRKRDTFWDIQLKTAPSSGGAL